MYATFQRGRDLKYRFGDIAPTAAKFEELKRLYTGSRDSFNENPESGQELDAWRNKQEDFKYKYIKGLVPQDLVGKEHAPGNAWVTSDTFFSEYKDHNPTNKILSVSDNSYIIGNVASYNSRQYLGTSGKEGQGFGHCLVIPQKRIYNIVDPAATANDCFIIWDMHCHFIDFWINNDGREKLLGSAI
ncbi:MAG: hypothetical protein L6R38_002792 [Xanthoria sp. 2 TBL-2021]|nr:MAG: hypothetical protein L6R38_002792 [Xanthoria sp. 2 TBL-2021]